MINITVILTCYNRKEKTVNCLKSLVEGNPNVNFNFVIVDDNSSDGTKDAILKLGYDACVIEGSGKLFWAGGMRMGIDYFLASNPFESDFCLLINDDVQYFDGAIQGMLQLINNDMQTVLVGATCDYNGNFTYGLRKLRSCKGTFLEPVLPNNSEIRGDTMNANCVLLSNSIVKSIGNFDSKYTHSLADFDYGFTLSGGGYKLISSCDYVGICEKNSAVGTWRDKNLSLKERFALKESPKGCPFKEWWHYLHKNYGTMIAIRFSITSYIRLLLNL